MRDPGERDASLALRSGRGNHLRKAIGWYRTHDRLHTGDPVAMASDALAGYLTDQKTGKDSLLICDTWEMADALNRRLHDSLTTDGPTARAARGQQVRVGDLVISRHNDATTVVRPSAAHRHTDAAGQVRNGNRWRVTAIDSNANRIAAERLTDDARVVFDTDYFAEHVTLGYAVTVHSAQGVTTDTAHAIISECATRSMAYVAMTRGRESNHAYIYTPDTTEAEQSHQDPLAKGEIHHPRRGTKYSAAQHLRDIIRRVLGRHDQRLTARADAWREHAAATEDFRTAYERITADLLIAQRGRHIGGLDL
ncbi:hypothetical protein HNP02_001509 [Mycobacterium sp. AZCC_0083]|nr:hypothetical protein [Mycobacterium sp. AZCC_0083]